MFLHKDKTKFEYLIAKTAEFFKINTSIVEKDYYVSLLLKELVQVEPNLIFKGGTSLSKCFKIINRFSEDIDVSMVSVTLSNRRKIKNSILEMCEKLDFNIVNLSIILSHRKFNRYLIQYPRNHHDLNVFGQIILETAFITKSYPILDVDVSNYIYEYLIHENQLSLINQYQLNPFMIKSQTLERTFIDKIFALCDYFLKKSINRNSRHLYDMYFLYQKIKIDNDFKNLVEEVYKERSLIKSCLSAKENCSVNKTLEEIIKSEFFKSDYLSLTSNIVMTPLKYDDAVNILYKIIELKIFK